MADAEKVIKALELCESGCDDNGCVYLEEQNNRGGLAVCRCVDLMARDALELLKSQQAETEPSEAEMMVEHTDGTFKYVKDIDNIMLLAHKDYHITYTGAF